MQLFPGGNSGIDLTVFRAALLSLSSQPLNGPLHAGSPREFILETLPDLFLPRIQL